MRVKTSIRKFLFGDLIDKVSFLLKNNEKDILSLSTEVAIVKSDISGLSTEVATVKSYISGLSTEVATIKNDLKYINFELLSLPKTDKKKILLVGFYGAPNLGDELMLETLLQYLGNKKDIQITVMLADNPDYDIGKFENIDFIHFPKSIFDINNISGYFDVIIFGGGAIIDDSLYDKDHHNYADLGMIFVDLSIKSIHRGKELYCVALSSNTELRNIAYIKDLNFIITNAKHFSLRDENSFQTLKRAGVDVKRISLMYDLAIANKDITLIQREYKAPKNLGINLICNQDTVEEVSKILDDIIKGFSVEKINIELIPFYQYIDNDFNCYKKLIEKSKYQGIMRIASPPKTMAELIEIILRQDLVISMRYHCSLISLITGIPTLTICYDQHRHYYNKIEYLRTLLGATTINYSDLKNKKFSMSKIYKSIVDIPLAKRGKIVRNTIDSLIELCNTI